VRQQLGAAKSGRGCLAQKKSFIFCGKEKLHYIIRSTKNIKRTIYRTYQHAYS